MSSQRRTAGVIATYDQAAFIGEAVASLAAQVDEVIVVDDASPDETSRVLAELSYPNLRVIRNEHRSGVSRSFNTAVEATDADVIFIQGGDDRSTPDRVERQLRSLDDGRVTLSTSVPRVLSRAGSPLPDWVASEFFPSLVAQDTLAQLFFVGNMICAPAAAVRRSDFIALGGFHIGLDYLQDYHLWLKLAERGTVEILREPVVEYRKHTSNLSRAYLEIDSARLRRGRAELEFILTDFLANARPETLGRLAVANGMDLREFELLHTNERVALLELSHDDHLLVRRGLAFLLTKLGEKDGPATLERMGLTMADLGRFATKADHDNAGDVSRALAVRANHEALASPRRTRRRKGAV
jgi:glycosyltransferase involved in cell wall biosynthesis